VQIEKLEGTLKGRGAATRRTSLNLLFTQKKKKRRKKLSEGRKRSLGGGESVPSRVSSRDKLFTKNPYIARAEKNGEPGKKAVMSGGRNLEERKLYLATLRKEGSPSSPTEISQQQRKGRDISGGGRRKYESKNFAHGVTIHIF